ncbi:hypothetical protein DFQ26_008145 [Actinomortierella ambigua]|nr:hypothetical protein DFQ26_008145 [Actinomortierella ambigua]
MAVRKRKPAANGHHAPHHATVTTNNNANDSSNHTPKKKNVTSAKRKDTSRNPSATITQERPSLSRSSSMAKFLHSNLFVDHYADVKGSKIHVGKGTRKRVILILGILIGVVLASVLMRQTKDTDYIETIAQYFQDFELGSMLPSGMIPDEFLGNVSAMFKPDILTEEEFYPGRELKEEHDYSPYYPVTMIPGIVSTGLESWSTTHNCSRKYFRKRMWGTTTMFKAVLLDKECWISNMRLDSETGLDPEGIRLRAAQGLDAADYLVPGYWVWGRIIQNLAAIGYDNNNMQLASYDWRLAFVNLETRDSYFSKLKTSLEVSLKAHGRKNVMVSHSMGSLLVLYFFKWVESEQGGNGGPNWVNDHVHSFVNIAGPMLGVPKTLAAVLSGEVRDTAQLGVISAYVLEKFFSRRERADLFRSWGGLSSMMPKGGNKVWGNLEGAPDDGLHDEEETMAKIKEVHDEAANRTDYGDAESPTFGAMLAFAQGSGMKHHTMDESMELLASLAGDDYNNMLKNNYTVGVATTKEEIRELEKHQSSWANPLQVSLPIAPKMKLYCLYGVGKSTERSYTYNRLSDLTSKIIEQLPANVSDETSAVPNIFIDTSAHDEKLGISYGVHQGDGDGTVPLLSTGYMCVDGWKKDLYNPSKSPVITREYSHRLSASPVDIRGGKRTADHVDILGNYEVTKDLLAIVANRDGEEGLPEVIFSKIREYSAKIDLGLE